MVQKLVGQPIFRLCMAVSAVNHKDLKQTPFKGVCWKYIRSIHSNGMSMLIGGSVTAPGRANANASGAVTNKVKAEEIFSWLSKCWWETVIDFLPAAAYLQLENLYVYDHFRIEMLLKFICM